MKLYSLLFITLSGLLFMCACQTYDNEQKKQFDKTIQTYIDENNLTMQRLENGLYYHIQDKGDISQLIRLTDRVKFSYKGYFLSGDEFQTISEDHAAYYKVDSLIAGWQDALSLIGNKGRIHIIVPPHLGYGAKDTGIIPANSILVYELDVIAIE